MGSLRSLKTDAALGEKKHFISALIQDRVDWVTDALRMDKTLRDYVDSSLDVTPLQYAIMHKRTDLAMVLIDFKANILKTTDSIPHSPFILCCIHDQYRVGYRLFNSLSHPMDKGQSEWDPLAASVNFKSLRITEFLLPAYGWIAHDVETPDGLNLLQCAVKSGDAYVCELLLQNKFNPDVRFPETRLPLLHYSIYNGHIDAARILLSYGASPVIRDGRGRNLNDVLRKLPLHTRRSITEVLEDNKKGQRYRKDRVRKNFQQKASNRSWYQL
jgi:ankyrin repeat protein